MPQADGQIPTWRDFPDFYENPFVKAIAENEKWTVSDKDKRPIDMHVLIYQKEVWGMSFNRGHNPLVDLATLCETIPTAANNAYYLDALTDGYVVMDIEPRCPEKLKQKFLSLPYVYGETSMSGKGVHLVFELPADILDKYPAAKQKLALQHSSGNYEILLNHMVTFTRNSLPPSDNKQGPAAFRNIFELLAMEAKETSTAKAAVVDSDIDTDSIPYFSAIMNTLKNRDYKKTQKDFLHDDGSPDGSKYEFGMTGFYYNILNKLLPGRKYKEHTYTDDEFTIILYKIVQSKAPYRSKHDQQRNGMPWLCFIASTVVAKNMAPVPDKKGRGRKAKDDAEDGAKPEAPDERPDEKRKDDRGPDDGGEGE